LASTIFRQAALNRLAALDSMDAAAKTVRFKDLFAFVVLLLVFVGAFVWAISATAPVKVRGEGIVLQKAGLNEIVANGGGRIKKLILSVGVNVLEGQTIAELEKPEIEADLRRVQAELIDVKLRQKSLREFFSETEQRESKVEDDRITAIYRIQSSINRRQELLENRLKNVRSMIAQKIFTANRLIDIELQLTEATEKNGSLGLQIRTIETGRINRQKKQTLTLLDERQKVGELQRKITRLQERLQAESTVRSLHTGRVIELKVNRGDVVVSGTSLAVLSPVGNSSEADYGTLYVSPADGKRIKTGMKVELVPSTLKREQYGALLGVVEFVSAVPSTLESMQRNIKNAQLVKRLSGTGAPFEVRVSFTKNSKNISGFEWSASKGPSSKISPGTLFAGDIVVNRKTLLELLFPFVSQSYGT